VAILNSEVNNAVLEWGEKPSWDLQHSKFQIHMKVIGVPA